MCVTYEYMDLGILHFQLEIQIWGPKNDSSYWQMLVKLNEIWIKLHLKKNLSFSFSLSSIFEFGQWTLLDIN